MIVSMALRTAVQTEFHFMRFNLLFTTGLRYQMVRLFNYRNERIIRFDVNNSIYIYIYIHTWPISTEICVIVTFYFTLGFNLNA